MSPEVAEVLTRVSEEIEVQLGLLEREGVKYAQQYAWYVYTGSPRSGIPPKPLGMQSKVADLIRDLTLDELVAMRGGPR